MHLIPAETPDIFGDHGKAWAVDLAAMKAKTPNPDDCTIAMWIIYAPWAHPAWHSYAITLIHLRDVPGVKPAHIAKPGATHEMRVWAVNPEHRPEIGGPIHYLTPCNFGGQLIAAIDEMAAERIREDVRAICAGQLNPDTDARRQWIARYGDDLFLTEFREAKGRA